MTDQVAATGPGAIVVSLEWARRLHTAGWPLLESVFVWTNRTGTFVLVDQQEFLNPQYTAWQYFAAPTVAEILVRLPLQIHGRTLVIGHSNVAGDHVAPLGWLVRYCGWDAEGQKPLPAYVGQADTLANAAAALYCYLAERGLLPR